MLARSVRTVWAAARGALIIAALLQVAGAASALLIVVASELALDGVLDRGDRPGSRLAVALGLLAVATAISSSVGAIQQQQQRLLGEATGRLLWQRLLIAVTSVPLITWDEPAFNERLDRVRYRALDHPTAVVGALMGLLGALSGVVGLAFALLVINPFLVPLLVLAGVPSLLIARRASRIEFAFARSSTPVDRHRTYLKSLLTSRTNAPEIIAFESARMLRTRHDDRDAEFRDLLLGHVRRRQRLAVLSTLFSAAALTVTLILIVVLVDRGTLTLSEAGAAAIAARILGGQLNSAFGAAATLLESVPFLVDMYAFLDVHTGDDSVGAPRSLRRSVRLTRASFSYGSAGPLALSDVSMEVPAGRVVAVVGENGSGKSTLAKILAGLFQPSDGVLTWDGDEIPLGDVRASVTILFQDFIRYQMSILDNVSIAQPESRPDADRAASALQRVGLGDLISEQNDGLDTLLGKQLAEGTDLSGGQWQRLALARALYRDAPMIVLDEPTAALDPRAEHELFADVRRIIDGRSAVLISHRFSSVRLADYIYVMDKGKISERGTHDELMELDGRYAELYRLQATAYLR